MYRRTTIALFATLALTFAAWSLPAARGAGHGDEAAAAAGVPKKGGNGFVRALTSPFRAIGRLFGGKKDGVKLERLTEKDVKKFETVPLQRTTDAVNPAPPPPAQGVESGDAIAWLLSDGRAALAAGRLNEAVAMLSRAVSLGPERWEAHHLLGMAYFRKGYPEQSRLSFEFALRYGGRNADVLNDYGYALHRSGDNKGAVKQFKRALRLAPSNPLVWNNLALAQCRLGDYGDGFKSFTRAGGEFYGRLNTATQLVRAGRFEESLKHYEAARLLNPNSREVMQHLADGYKRLGRTAEAEEVARALRGESAEKPQQAKGR